MAWQRKPYCQEDCEDPVAAFLGHDAPFTDTLVLRENEGLDDIEAGGHKDRDRAGSHQGGKSSSGSNEPLGHGLEHVAAIQLLLDLRDSLRQRLLRIRPCSFSVTHRRTHV